MELEIGKAYFDVGYPIGSSDVPIIDTHIFIGMDVLGGEKGEYFFQSPDTFFKYGLFSEVTDDKVRSKVQISIIVPELVECLLDIEELSKFLMDSKTRSPQSFGVVSEKPS